MRPLEQEIRDVIKRVSECKEEHQVLLTSPKIDYTWLKISRADKEFMLDIMDRYLRLMR